MWGGYILIDGWLLCVDLCDCLAKYMFVSMCTGKHEDVCFRLLHRFANSIGTLCALSFDLSLVVGQVAW